MSGTTTTTTTTNATTSISNGLFLKDRHIRYFSASLHQLSGLYVKLDANRLTLVHFATIGLDVMGVWQDEAIMETYGLNKARIIDWIYSLQLPSGGFQGGTYTMMESSTCTESMSDYRQAHIAMTYCAMCTLRTLGDDLTRANRPGILQLLTELQRSDGSFACTVFPSEQDMRFLYCACATSYMLGDWSGVNRDLAVQYVKSCRAWDGGIALIPRQEGHGGSTFCGLAALRLMGRMEDVLAERNWRDEMVSWCCHRQIGGMQGRPGKAEDTCYSYWIGGTLRILGQDHLLDQRALRNYILSCQSTKMGGFGKLVGQYPDSNRLDGEEARNTALMLKIERSRSSFLISSHSLPLILSKFIPVWLVFLWIRRVPRLVLTDKEEAAVKDRIAKDFEPFGFTFTTEGPYSTIRFYYEQDFFEIYNLGDGFSSELDVTVVCPALYDDSVIEAADIGMVVNWVAEFIGGVAENIDFLNTDKGDYAVLDNTDFLDFAKSPRTW